MTDKDPAEGIRAAARKLQEEKLQAIEGLVESRAAITEAQRVLTAAQKADGVAYKAATDAGWTERELRAVGIAPPARQAVGRPKGSGGKARGSGGGTGSALIDSQLQREAAASARLDGETHVVGEPS